MSKKDFELLGKVFEAEVMDRLPFQSKSKEIEKLAEHGLVVRMQKKLGGRFPITLSGWQLTLFGNYTYCQECAKRPMPEDAEL